MQAIERRGHARTESVWVYERITAYEIRLERQHVQRCTLHSGSALQEAKYLGLLGIWGRRSLAPAPLPPSPSVTSAAALPLV